MGHHRPPPGPRIFDKRRPPRISRVCAEARAAARSGTPRTFTFLTFLSVKDHSASWTRSSSTVRGGAKADGRARSLLRVAPCVSAHARRTRGGRRLSNTWGGGVFCGAVHRSHCIWVRVTFLLSTLPQWPPQLGARAFVVRTLRIPGGSSCRTAIAGRVRTMVIRVARPAHTRTRPKWPNQTVEMKMN